MDPVKLGTVPRMKVSDELQDAILTLRASTISGAAEMADLFEETARTARIIEGVWEVVGHSAEKQKEQAEGRWRFELAVARALRPSSRASQGRVLLVSQSPVVAARQASRP
jgi:hypothetical protein